MKTICATGHRPDDLPWKRDHSSPLKQQFLQRLEEAVEFCIANGYSAFISGGALGVDTEFALCVLKMKQRYPHVTLEIAVPCTTQRNGWSKENQSVYDGICLKADFVTVLSKDYYSYCMQMRNKYMVDKSDAVLCCWSGKKNGGTYSTIKLAQKAGKKLLLIDLSSDPENGGNQMLIFKDKLA